MEQTASAVQTPPHAPKENLETQYRFEPVLSSWLLWVLIVGTLFAVWRGHTRSTRTIGLKQRLTLWSLRTLAVLVVAVCLVRPVAVTRTQMEERAQAFIALDTSASMNFRDESGGLTRWEIAQKILTAQRSQLEALDAQTNFHRFTFDSTTSSVSRLPGELRTPVTLPAGTSTDILSFCEKLRHDGSGIPNTGAILLSDGRHNATRDVVPAAMALGRAGVPLYIIGLGFDAPPADYKDIRIKQLILPEKSFAGGRMRISLEVESTLTSRQVTPLTVYVDDKQVYQKRIEFAAGANVPLPMIEIPYMSDLIGVHRVTAKLDPLPGESNLSNNNAVGFFRTFRSRIGVWYAEGSVRKEFGAIRTALETAPNVLLRALNAFMTRSGNEQDLLPSEDEWATIKLIIIGDIPATRFQKADLKKLAKFVEDGGSILMIGGFNTLGAGLWQNSALAAVLPVDLSIRDGMSDGPLTLRLGEEKAHPILKITETPEQSLEFWKKLPSVAGVNNISGVKPLAHTLLYAGTNPLLVVHEYGRGRSGVFTSDMTWQWILKANQAEAHKAFWRNLVTWLTRSDYRDASKAVFADADKLQYEIGENANFGAHVHETEKDAKAIAAASIIGTLSRIEDNRETVLIQETLGHGVGDFARRLTFSQPGAYRFKASVMPASGGPTIDSDSLDVYVTQPDLESDNPRANITLLRRMAALSGGMYFNPENADKAFAALLKPQATYTQETMDVQDLWNTPWVLGIFIFILSLEWIVRKRWGLI